MRLSAGAPHPLGATWDGRSTNFALFSAHAEKVELCLFNSDGGHELARMALPERTEDIWHGYLDDIGPGQLYGYRVHGPYEAERGLRFNANKLLVDPYAKELAGTLALNDTHFGYQYGNARNDLSFDQRDNARTMPKAVVTNGAVLRSEDRRPHIPWEDTIIYEAHVKGLTQLREDIPPAWRGRFRALAEPAIVNHLKRLGVTTLELLPIHGFIDDWHVVRRGLSNYWGYNTLSFFTPETRYGSNGTLDEFRSTVARLHDAGIEIVLDVVYNHTCEGDHLGPTLSFRGIDNLSYYWLKPDEPRFYENFTGCGNALNLTHPRVLQMVIESLRYWAETCQIDGFRFDLATTLARSPGGFDGGSAFFAAIRNDPVLAGVKLIAEPWDVGADGYRVGAFPAPWSEWNDRFRSTLRRYWRGDGNLIGELGRRMTASADLFQQRAPCASINYITVHDGFTLADLVSYVRKHNAANCEENRDGSDDNQSTNCGVEGPTDDAQIVELRRQLRRNLLSCLMLAQGTPLLLAGDEVGNGQGGNNNAYCQDNDIGWVNWSGLSRDDDMTALIARLADLRRRFPQLRAQRWLEGRRVDGSYDVLWFTPQATEMTQQDWNFPDARFLSYLLAPMEQGQPSLYIMLNAAREAIAVTLPRLPECQNWTAIINTASQAQTRRTFAAGSTIQAPACCVFVFSGAA
jgi:isoamylase